MAVFYCNACDDAVDEFGNCLSSPMSNHAYYTLSAYVVHRNRWHEDIFTHVIEEEPG